MMFNIDKCHILHMGSSNPHHTYYMNGSPLKVVEVEKDLGVHIHDSCKPSTQVAVAAKKANAVLGQLFRGFSYRDSTYFLRLYLQYVRPHLEYAVQAWCPWLRADVDLLENIQKRAIRAISGLSGTYEEKLATLGIPSLEDRRYRGDMIQVYKVLHKIDNVDPANYFTRTAGSHQHATRSATTITDNTISEAFGLVPEAPRTEIRRQFFTVRSVSKWNDLPKRVQESPSVNSFENNFDNFIRERNMI